MAIIAVLGKGVGRLWAQYTTTLREDNQTQNIQNIKEDVCFYTEKLVARVWYMRNLFSSFYDCKHLCKNK
jgi:hypothetical protein